MKNFKENGITLIALVVTIIILLILAGVIIGMATSRTGLFDKAKEATQKYQNTQEDEGIQIAKYSNMIDSYVSADRISSSKFEYGKSQVSGSNVSFNVGFDNPKIIHLKIRGTKNNKEIQYSLFLEATENEGEYTEYGVYNDGTGGGAWTANRNGIITNKVYNLLLDNSEWGGFDVYWVAIE